MKIEVDKKEFIKSLQAGGAFARAKAAVSILECVKIKVKGGCLTVISYDTENAISKKMYGVQSDTDGEFCVKVDDLQGYVKLIKSDKFTMETSGNVLVVTHEKGNAEMPIFPVEQYPVIKTDDADAISFDISASMLQYWASNAVKFSSNDDFRATMKGMYFYGDENEIGCCATDSRSLFTDCISNESKSVFSCILNKETLKPIYTAFDSASKMNVTVGSRNVTLRQDGISIISRLVEGRYPNFKSVIPNTTTIEAKINKSEMMEALARCTQSLPIPHVTLKFEGMGMEISCKDLDFNRERKETLMTGGTPNSSISFNATYLQNILSSIVTDDVVLKFTDHAHAALLTNDGEYSTRYVLMPVNVD